MRFGMQGTSVRWNWHNDWQTSALSGPSAVTATVATYDAYIPNDCDGHAREPVC